MRTHSVVGSGDCSTAEWVLGLRMLRYHSLVYTSAFDAQKGPRAGEGSWFVAAVGGRRTGVEVFEESMTAIVEHINETLVVSNV